MKDKIQEEDKLGKNSESTKEPKIIVGKEDEQHKSKDPAEKTDLKKPEK